MTVVVQKSDYGIVVKNYSSLKKGYYFMSYFTREKHELTAATPWEKTVAKMLSPFNRFMNSANGSGILLVFLTIVALVFANTSCREWYERVLNQQLLVQMGSFKIDMTIHYWINDALMTLFFLMVGLEIKYEMKVGRLASLKRAVLPIFAALGGMIVPALIYFSFNSQGETVSGWGIPMATDIAFAIAILLLLKGKVSPSLTAVLVALAIVDDLGAVIVIAIFYTDNLAWSPLIAAFLCFAVLLLLNRGGIRALWAYIAIGSLMWVFMLFSGVHATVAGVLTALATPMNAVYSPTEFSTQARQLLDEFDAHPDSKTQVAHSRELNDLLQQLSTGIQKTQTPLQRLEHILNTPVYFLIVPLFVLFNAGVHVELNNLNALLHSPVLKGVFFGLVFGKLIGVVSAIMICVKLKIAALPADATFKQVLGIGMLAGIGFTMSIFVSELAFSGQAQHLAEAKITILAASLTAATLGYCWLRFITGAAKAETGTSVSQ